MNQKNQLLFLPALLGLLLIPYGYFVTWATGLFGNFFFLSFAICGLLLYGLWWALGKLCASLTRRPLLSMLLLNAPAVLLFIFVLTGSAGSGFLFTATLPIISLPVVMLPQLGSNGLLYLMGLALAFAFSFLGCASVREKS